MIVFSEHTIEKRIMRYSNADLLLFEKKAVWLRYGEMTGKKKAASEEAAFQNMVAMAGLEPATPAL